MLCRFLLLSLLVSFQTSILAEDLQPLYPNTEVRDVFRALGPEKVRYEEPNPGSYSKNRRVFSQVSEPAYKIVKAEESKNTGVAVVIFPGGGFVDVWFDKEGSDIAHWLSKRGITSMIVKYSTMHDADGKRIMQWQMYREAVKQDTARAIEILRSLAPKIKVDPGKIGVMGFSAGAAAVHWHMFDKKKDGQCCVVNEKTRPSFVGLIYGAGFSENKPDPALELLDNPGDLPPFYMVVADKDPYFNFESRDLVDFYYNVLKTVPTSELHVYGAGGHGFALDKNGYSVSLWLDNFYLWLKDLGIIGIP